MRICFVTFRSITYAQRAREILNRSGISTELSRTPGSLEKKGCGYSLCMEFRSAARAGELLRRNHVPYGRFYCRGESGALEALV